MAALEIETPGYQRAVKRQRVGHHRQGLNLASGAAFGLAYGYRAYVDYLEARDRGQMLNAFKSTQRTMMARRRYRGRRRRGRRRYSSVRRVGRKLVNKLKNIHIEWKCHDYSQADYSIPQIAVGNLGLNLTNIDQGDTVSTRDGNLIYPKKLLLRMRFRQNATVATQQMVRYMLVRFKVANADAQTLGSVIANPSNIQSFRALINAKLMRVILDRRFYLGLEAGMQIGDVEHIIPLKGSIRYNGLGS